MHKRHHNLDNEKTARHICLVMMKIAYGSDVTALVVSSLRIRDGPLTPPSRTFETLSC